MALENGSLIEIVHVGALFSQQVMTVWDFEVISITGATSAIAVAEAYWNHIKTTWRAMCVTSNGQQTLTLRVRELNNPVGEYAEFDIPSGEQAGTRTPPTQGELLPPFVAAGARLTVSTRTTRPGQKRIPNLVESDNLNGALQSAMKALVQAYLNVATFPMVLGAPAALTELSPIVCRKNAAGLVTAHQPITGYLVNNNITSQNTRKIGRGA